MAKPQANGTEQVDAHVATLEPNKQEMISYIRQFILALSADIEEQLKWNSASFYYTGQMPAFDPKLYKRDIMVCNVHRGKLLLVLPTGAKVKDQLKAKDYPDGRKIIPIADLEDLKAKEAAIKQVVVGWLQLVND